MLSSYTDQSCYHYYVTKLSGTRAIDVVVNE